MVGAGTMGGGIAQVAAVAGHPVTVYDAVEGAAERAVAAVRDRVAGLVARGRLDLDPPGCASRRPANSANWRRPSA